MRHALLLSCALFLVLPGCPRSECRARCEDTGDSDAPIDTTDAPPDSPLLDAPAPLLDAPMADDAPVLSDTSSDAPMPLDAPMLADAPMPVDAPLDVPMPLDAPPGVDASAPVDAPALPLGAGLVALYDFEETSLGTAPSGADFSDAVGGHHGALTGGGTPGVPGVLGGAVRLDGVSGVITIPDGPGLRPSEVTMAAWFALASPPSPAGGVTLLSRPQSGPPWSYPYLAWMIRINALDTIEASIGSSGSYGGAFPVPTLSVGAWHHVVLTYDGTSARLHLDGVLIGENVLGGPIAYAALPLLVGADYGADPFADHFPGDVDQLAVWDRVLTPADVANLYGGGAGAALP